MVCASQVSRITRELIMQTSTAPLPDSGIEEPDTVSTCGREGPSASHPDGRSTSLMIGPTGGETAARARGPAATRGVSHDHRPVPIGRHRLRTRYQLEHNWPSLEWAASYASTRNK
jgi:hypothetical protein